MAYKYSVKEMPHDWKLAKYYFPKFDLESCKIFEVNFPRIISKQAVDIKLTIPSELKNKRFKLYFSDGKGNVTLIPFKQVKDTLIYSTNKVGVYVLLEVSEETYSSKISQIIHNATNISKSIVSK